MSFNVWDYVKVLPMEEWEIYQGMLCNNHSIHEWKVAQITQRFWEEPNVFYKLDIEDMLSFSNGMLELTDTPTQQSPLISSYPASNITPSNDIMVVPFQNPPQQKVNNIPVLNTQLSPEDYVEDLMLFVKKYRTAFVQEELFWEFFRDKAIDMLYLKMNGVVNKNTKPIVVEEPKKVLTSKKIIWKKKRSQLKLDEKSTQ